MSATSRRASRRDRDPRVVRTRAAALAAARDLFLEQGYAGTTMDEVAAKAGLARRTLYNNYADKRALFAHMIEDTIAFAEQFAQGLRDDVFTRITAENLRPSLEKLARRLALGIVRPEVVALRRLLVGEAREFPGYAADYWDRAPGQVLDALSSGFDRLTGTKLLRIPDPRLAAAQFAYLVAGEPLDHAVLVGVLPDEKRIAAAAREGVRTFLARYAIA